MKAQDVCHRYNRDPSKGHQKQIKKLFKECGEHVMIEKGFHCDYGQYISIAERVYININCTILDGGNVHIGSDCLIGPNVQIITINHPTNPTERLQKTSIAQDVVIGKNVWIGAGAIILPGVTIEDNAVVGAAAVVTRKVTSGSTVVGNPAKILT